jgi:glycosyltransferase involved in cell wall biosynthesis
MLTGRDIICLSTHYWDDAWFRKQQFMSRFCRDNRVLFVEPTFSIVRRPEAHHAKIASNRSVGIITERRSESLTLLKPPRALPKPYEPITAAITYRRFARSIRTTAGKLNFRKPIIWVYEPRYLLALPSLSYSKLVLDLADDLAAYSGRDRSAQLITHCVEGLVDQCDLLLVTARTLFDRYVVRKAGSIHHLPNGFDPALFSSAGAESKSSPADLAGVPRPLIGFVGVLFDFLDYELMEHVAKSLPGKSLVLVGPVESSSAEAVDRLTRLPNVHALGGKPRQDIPHYLAQFDVCINPFLRNAVSRSVNPLKVYEYLAAGKPVVSTPLESLQREDVGEVISFAATHDEFVTEVEASLSTAAQQDSIRLRRRVEPYSWDRLFQRVSNICGANL